MDSLFGWIVGSAIGKVLLWLLIGGPIWLLIKLMASKVSSDRDSHKD